MRTDTPLGMLIGIVIPVVLLGGDRPASADLRGAAPPRAITQVAWRLTDAAATSRGKTVAVREGLLTSGYVIQSTATSIGDGRFRRGRFELTGTLFGPGVDGPRQRPSAWHINATWTIIDPHPSPNDRGETPYVAGGRLQAVLDFNPLEEPGMIEASLFLTNVQPAGGRMVGQGTFSGNQRFEGMLSWKLLESSAVAARATTGAEDPKACLLPGSRTARTDHRSALKALREMISARSGSPYVDTSPAGTPH